MRRFALALLAVTVAACTGGSPVLGRWKASSFDGRDSVLYFKKDQTVEALSGGEKLVGTWSMNRETDPQQLTLVFDQKSVSAIVRFEEDSMFLESVATKGLSEAEAPPKQFSSQAQEYRRQ